MATTSEHLQSMLAGLARGDYPIYQEGRTTTMPREQIAPEALAYLGRMAAGLRWWCCTSPRSGRRYKTSDPQLAARRAATGWRLRMDGLAVLCQDGQGGMGIGHPQAHEDDRPMNAMQAMYDAVQLAQWAALVELRESL